MKKTTFLLLVCCVMSNTCIGVNDQSQTAINASAADST